MISVCIPTFNGALHIGEQLQSILSQLGPADEVIVSDDGSTDDTLGVIRRLGDPRVRVFRHPPFDNPYRGPWRTIHAVYRNVEHAMSHVSGDVIFLSDQDDVWLPGKVARVMMELEGGVELVLHDSTVVADDGKVLLRSYFDYSRPGRGWFRFVTKCFYPGSAMAFTRRVGRLSLPFPRLGLAHDQWIATVEWTHGKRISFIREPLMLYRRHEGAASTGVDKSRNSLVFKLLYRVNTLRAIAVAALRR
jgi:glycosyltransferase involved in cell wall biosynthesis